MEALTGDLWALGWLAVRAGRHVCGLMLATTHLFLLCPLFQARELPLPCAFSPGHPDGVTAVHMLFSVWKRRGGRTVFGRSWYFTRAGSAGLVPGCRPSTELARSRCSANAG